MNSSIGEDVTTVDLQLMMVTDLPHQPRATFCFWFWGNATRTCRQPACPTLLFWYPYMCRKALGRDELWYGSHHPSALSVLHLRWGVPGGDPACNLPPGQKSSSIGLEFLLWSGWLACAGLSFFTSVIIGSGFHMFTLLSTWCCFPSSCSAAPLWSGHFGSLARERPPLQQNQPRGKTSGEGRCTPSPSYSHPSLSTTA